MSRKLRIPRIMLCVISLLAFLAADAQQPEPEGKETITIGGKRLTFSYEVFKTAEKLSDHSQLLLRSLGIASTGPTGIGFVQVKVSDGRSASGWINADGKLKSVVCVEGDSFFAERRATEWRPIRGQFQDFTKAAQYEGNSVTATYSLFSSADLLEESSKLLAYAGIGIRGVPSRVRLKFQDGRSGVGFINEKGEIERLSMTGWEEPKP